MIKEKLRGRCIDIKEVYIVKGLNESLGEIECKLNSLIKIGEKMAITLDQILEKVTEQDTRLDSVRELIIGLRKQVKDLMDSIGGISPENQAKIDAIFAAAEKNSAEIEEAITENTPPEPPA